VPDQGAPDRRVDRERRIARPAGRERPSGAAVEPAARIDARLQASPRGEAPALDLDLSKLARGTEEAKTDGPPAVDPFARRSFAPAQGAPQAAPAAAPAAPLLPFVYLGKAIEDGKLEVFLSRGEKSYSVRAGQKIALFFTGRKHAGENLAAVLARRAVDLGPPIQMCDALARNLPKPLQVILANCIAHGRRRFVEVAHVFPEECRYVLETLGEVYKNDALCWERGTSPEERLRFHQARSRPLMEKLASWMHQQFTERKVEPNSGLGQAISYMQKHWRELTLFLRQAGAPLDNNVCERALKKAILHRKNSFFYKTRNGAHVGDLFMTLIHTCQLCDVNAFDYLIQLLKHPRDLSRKPQEWMPWNYREMFQSAK